MPIRLRSWALCALVLVLDGCASVGPDYHPPEVPVPAAYPVVATAPDAHQSAADSQLLLGQWWTILGDQTLQILIDRALQDNPDLWTAVSRIRQARAEVIIAGADEYPTLAANAQASRVHLSKNGGFAELASSFSGGGGGAGAGGAQIAIPGLDLSLFQLGFDASWEIDLVGRDRRAVEGARAKAEAAVWSARDVQVSLEAQVVTTYAMLRAAQGQLVVLQDDAQRERTLLAIIQASAASGVSDGTTLAEQRLELAQSAAQVPGLQSQVVVARHALAILLGEEPSALDAELADAAAVPAVPELLSVGLPSELLRRRPDLRAAERQLAAASADIGVAVADLYPSVDLTASLALVSDSLRTLFSWSGSHQYQGAAVVNWPLFNGGKIHANITVAKEADAQALLRYRSAILSALKDVEDALARYGAERIRNRALHDAEAAAQSAWTIAVAQSQVGTVPGSERLTREGALLSARSEAIASDAQLLMDVVALYKSLGGGWQEPGPDLRDHLGMSNR